MTTLLSVSARLYAAALPLYPRDLRQEFGSDMAEVFNEDLSDAVERAGLRGAIQVWYRSVWELLRFALPGHMENPLIAVPCIIFALSELVMSGELMLAVSRRIDFANAHLHTAAIPFFAMGPSLLA